MIEWQLFIQYSQLWIQFYHLRQFGTIYILPSYNQKGNIRDYFLKYRCLPSNKNIELDLMFLRQSADRPRFLSYIFHLQKVDWYWCKNINWGAGVVNKEKDEIYVKKLSYIGKINIYFLKDIIYFFLNRWLCNFHLKLQQFHNIVYSMCFLKTLTPLDDMSVEKGSFQDLTQPLQASKLFQNQYSAWNNLLLTQNYQLFTKQDQLLLNLMTMVSANNSYLLNLQQKLTQNEEHLGNACLEADNLTQESAQKGYVVQQNMPSFGDVSTDQEETTVNPLLTQLFGKKRYHYKLQLQQAVPTTIFKERNINISVNLVDMNNEKIMNSNIIHLCLAVCDANGQWVTQNRVGQAFMKGKTEVEMFHGEGSFLKVYPRDVSRSYTEGKINFVVYCKASMLKFSSNASAVEKVVDSDLIEPLLISDVSIKAKKKD